LGGGGGKERRIKKRGKGLPKCPSALLMAGGTLRAVDRKGGRRPRSSPNASAIRDANKKETKRYLQGKKGGRGEKSALFADMQTFLWNYTYIKGRGGGSARVARSPSHFLEERCTGDADGPSPGLFQRRKEREGGKERRRVRRSC